MSKEGKKTLETAYGDDFVVNGYVIIDGEEIPTVTRKITSANVISVTVGTNGYQGGDSGHGCRTFFRLKDESSTDMSCRLSGKSCGDTGQVEITLGGDCELETFIQALEFAADELRKMS